MRIEDSKGEVCRLATSGRGAAYALICLYVRDPLAADMLFAKLVYRIGQAVALRKNYRVLFAEPQLRLS